MARRVEDPAVMMSLLAGPDDADPTVVAMPFVDPAQVDLSKLRVVYGTDSGHAATAPDVAQVIRAAAASLFGIVKSVRQHRPSVLAAHTTWEMKLPGADGGYSLRPYLEHLGSTPLHPLLTG